MNTVSSSSSSNTQVYPYEEGRVPMNRFFMNLGLALASAALIGFQRVYEAVNFKMQFTKPTFVAFITSGLMFLIFTPVVLYRHGFTGISYIYRTRSWLYLVFAIFEIQGYYMYNFAIINTTIYTYILAGLVGIATLIQSRWILNTRYRPFHLLGCLLCFIGLIFVSASELPFNITLSENTSLALILVYLSFAVFSIPLYSSAYISLEASIRQFSIPECLMFYGLYGLIINTLTLIFIDKYQLDDNWSGETWSKVAALLLTILCKSFELIVACFLIMSSNAVYYSNSKIIGRLFFILFTHFKIKLLDPVEINWMLIVGGITFYIGLGIFGIYQMPVARDKTQYINFYKRPN